MADKAQSKPFSTEQARQLDELAGFSKCIGYEKIAVVSTAVKGLTIPKNARWALITVQADPAVSSAGLDTVSRVIYFREDGGNPTAGDANVGDGLPLGDLGIYEVKGIQNMRNFKMIGIRADEANSVRVLYYGE